MADFKAGDKVVFMIPKPYGANVKCGKVGTVTRQVDASYYLVSWDNHEYSFHKYEIRKVQE